MKNWQREQMPRKWCEKKAFWRQLNEKRKVRKEKRKKKTTEIEKMASLTQMPAEQ